MISMIRIARASLPVSRHSQHLHEQEKIRRLGDDEIHSYARRSVIAIGEVGSDQFETTDR